LHAENPRKIYGLSWGQAGGGGGGVGEEGMLRKKAKPEYYLNITQQMDTAKMDDI
jgi:hypothetical protein